MPLIPYPNVPKLLGVPDIPRSPNFPTVVRSSLGIAQSIIWQTIQRNVQWGIFDSKGNALGDPSNLSGLLGTFLNTIGLVSSPSTGSVDYSKETRVSDFPIEGGKFASYNKVEMPSTPVVTLIFNGTESDRSAFLAQIDKACKSTDLYTVATPTTTYINHTIERYNYQRRSNRGATLFVVEIFLKEVRQVSAIYSKSNKGEIGKAKDAKATPQVDGGKVQAPAVSASTAANIAKKIPQLGNYINSYIQGLGI